MKSESESEDEVEIVTPLDEWVIHKPSETKYDTLTGLIPFEIEVGF